MAITLTVNEMLFEARIVGDSTSVPTQIRDLATTAFPLHG